MRSAADEDGERTRDRPGGDLLAGCVEQLRAIAPMATRRVHVETQDVEDVVQEALLKAHASKTPAPRDPHEQMRWLVTLLVLASMEHRKRLGRRSAREDVRPMEEMPPMGGFADVETAYVVCDVLWRCKARLPPKLRVIFQRMDIDGEDVDTVAREEGISVAATWTRLDRARKQMKAEIDALDREGEHDGRCAMVLPLLASLDGLDRAIVSSILAVVPPPDGVAELQATEAMDPPASVDEPPPWSGLRAAGFGAGILATVLALASDAGTMGDGRVATARAGLPQPFVFVLPAPEAPAPPSVPAAPGGCKRSERPAATPNAAPRGASASKDVAALVEAYTQLHEGKSDRARQAIAEDERARPDAPERQTRDDLRATAGQAAPVEGRRAP